MNKLIRLFVVFIVLCISNIILSYIHNSYLNLDALQIEKTAKTLTKTQLEKVLQQDKETIYVNFAVITFSILLKVFAVTFVLFIGSFLYNVKITFIRLFNLVIKLEFIFLLPIIYEIIYFKFINTGFTLEEVGNFYPLSALNIIGYKNLETYFIYPFQVLNLFELAYWLLLSYFIGKLAFTERDKGKPMDLGLKIVVSSYGSALLLWVVVVMFFTLNYS
uniref:hypothetical protein n=2 Tax=Flavobacterium sp. TaxID=239 RepID=UPI0040486A9D